MSVKNERLKNVDFLRFIFAVLIVLFHFRGAVPLFKTMVPSVIHWNICVEFFFIISGFFLFNHYKKEESSFNFIVKKFLRLAPLIWLFLILLGIFYFISNQVVPFDYYILRALLLSNIGFAPPTLNGTHWFIPVLFWVSVFYFYIAKIFPKKYLNLIVWLVTIGSLGIYLQWNNYDTGGVLGSLYLVKKGVLRGLYGLGIGYFINELYTTDLLKECSKIGKAAISFCEAGLIAFFVYFLGFTTRLPGKSAFLYVGMFSVLFFLFLRNKGFISNILNNNLSTVLGNSSYAIYIFHTLVQYIFCYSIYRHNKALIEAHLPLTIFLYLLCLIVVAMLIHYFVEEPVNRFVKRKMSGKN